MGPFSCSMCIALCKKSLSFPSMWSCAVCSKLCCALCKKRLLWCTVQELATVQCARVLPWESSITAQEPLCPTLILLGSHSICWHHHHHQEHHHHQHHQFIIDILITLEKHNEPTSLGRLPPLSASARLKSPPCFLHVIIISPSSSSSFCHHHHFAVLIILPSSLSSCHHVVMIMIIRSSVAALASIRLNSPPKSLLS